MRPRRRWSLGGFMVLIAIVAVPLAMYARRPKLEEYPERAAWQALSERRIKRPKADVLKVRKAADGGVTLPVVGGTAR